MPKRYDAGWPRSWDVILGAGLAGAVIGATLVAWWLSGAPGVISTAVKGVVPAGQADARLLDLIIALCLGSYAFTWGLYARLESRIANHVSHDLDALRARVAALERQIDTERQ